MKVALAYWYATCFISRERAYHGAEARRRCRWPAWRTTGAGSARRSPAVHMRHTHLKENFFQPGEGRHDNSRGPRSTDQSLRGREHRSLLRRADCGLHRLPRTPQGVSEAPVRLLRRRSGCLLVFDEVITASRSRRRAWRHAGPDDDGQGPHERRAADGRGRDRRRRSTGAARGRESSTVIRTPDILPRAPRALRPSIYLSAMACSRGSLFLETSGRRRSPPATA